ncbi:MAG: DinB family protein [bacterium]
MREVERIQDQLRRAFAGDAWHGPSVLEVLNGITAEQAATRPVASAHSIWEIVLHIAAWEGACARRLSGDRAELPTEEDWPAVSQDGNEAWERTKTELREGHHRLQEAITRVEDARLDEPILQGMTSVYATLHGAVQHDLYHAGQIAILKKMAAATEIV